MTERRCLPGTCHRHLSRQRGWHQRQRRELSRSRTHALAHARTLTCSTCRQLHSASTRAPASSSTTHSDSSCSVRHSVLGCSMLQGMMRRCHLRMQMYASHAFQRMQDWRPEAVCRWGLHGTQTLRIHSLFPCLALALIVKAGDAADPRPCARITQACMQVCMRGWWKHAHEKRGPMSISSLPHTLLALTSQRCAGRAAPPAAPGRCRRSRWRARRAGSAARSARSAARAPRCRSPPRSSTGSSAP